MSNSEYFYVAIDPVAFSVGPLSVHWYGIMYLLAFVFFWVGGRYLAQKRRWFGWKPEEVGDFLFYGMVVVVESGILSLPPYIRLNIISIYYISELIIC